MIEAQPSDGNEKRQKAMFSGKYALQHKTKKSEPLYAPPPKEGGRDAEDDGKSFQLVRLLLLWPAPGWLRMRTVQYRLGIQGAKQGLPRLQNLNGDLSDAVEPILWTPQYCRH